MCRVFKKAGHAIGDFWRCVILTKHEDFVILFVAGERKSSRLCRGVDATSGFGKRRIKEKRMKRAKYDKTLPRRMYQIGRAHV